MSLSLDLCGSFLVASGLCTTVGGWAIPAGCACVVIDIIGSSQVVFSSFPTSRESALVVLKRTQLAGRS